jgi:glycosyltransferase involved in cell wall biosynthesis
LKKTCNPARLARYGIGVLSGARALARIAAAHEIGVIHANSIYSAFYAAPAARMAGIRSVCHLRDMVSMRWLSKCVLGGFDAVVPISRAVARFYGLDAGTVIPSGVDFDRFPESAAGIAVLTDAGIPGDAPVAGTVSQLVPWKNHGHFLRAASRMLSELDDAHFVVAGSDLFGDHPGYGDELSGLARQLGIEERVHFIGWREDMSQLYAALDVLVHPAEAEPFGRVLVEAMGCGVPVVAYDSAGPSEIVKDGKTGFLAPAGDWESLASAACSILSDEGLRSSLGAAAGKDVRSRFAADLIAYRVMKLYGLEV